MRKATLACLSYPAGQRGSVGQQHLRAHRGNEIPIFQPLGKQQLEGSQGMPVWGLGRGERELDADVERGALTPKWEV